MKKETIRLFLGIIRRVLKPKKYKSVEYLCSYLGDDVILNDRANDIKKKRVTHICTLSSSYFPPHNACLVYRNPVYGDTDILELAKKAMRNGALVLITNQSIPDYPCIISNDPVKTYSLLCKYYREFQTKVRITAVTGSIGKTTTKNLIGEVYKTKFKTLYSEENNNTKTTVGFAVQHIPNWAEMMVQEVHEGEPNETQWISLMLQPEVIVLTSIDNSHYQFFGSADRIVEECCSVTKFMSENGTVIINSDEFCRYELLNGRKVKSVSIKDANADFYASNVEVNAEGLSFVINIKETGDRATAKLKSIFAKHNIISALYAFAAGYCQGIPINDIIKGISNFRTSGIRQNIIKTSDGVTLYVDCYNAVGKSMKSAIEACDSISISGRRIAVLGDIAEVGDLSESMHRDVVSYVNESKFDVLFTIGDKLKQATTAISCRDSLHILSFDNREVLSKQIKQMVVSGDLVLFKASNSGNLRECITMVWPETDTYMCCEKKHSGLRDAFSILP